MDTSRTVSRGATVVAVLILLGVVVLVIYLAGAAWNAFANLPATVTGPVVVAALTVLGSVATFVAGKSLDRRREIENALRQQKVPVYEDILSFWFRQLYKIKTTGELVIDKAEVREYLAKNTHRLLVWSSDQVVRSYSAFRTADNEDPISYMLTFEKFMYAIRADLGHSNRGLVEGDLLAFFVNDVKEKLAERKAMGK